MVCSLHRILRFLTANVLCQESLQVMQWMSSLGGTIIICREWGSKPLTELCDVVPSTVPESPRDGKVIHTFPFWSEYVKNNLAIHLPHQLRIVYVRNT